MDLAQMKKLENQIARQCAPLLSGVKMSNLLIIRNEFVQDVYSIFQQTQISVHLLYQTDKNTGILLYKSKELNEYLNTYEISKILLKMGYRNPNDVLNRLNQRYQTYVDSRKDFPHELGIFLGYPIDDVIGFIENGGKDYLYTGYWKVYGNLNEKIVLFEQFNRAKQMVIKLLEKGESIRDIMNLQVVV